MTSLDIQKDRLSPIIPIARVTICLDADHNKCSGAYVDFTGNHVVKCICPCHSHKKRNTDDASIFDDTQMTVTGNNGRGIIAGSHLG